MKTNVLLPNKLFEAAETFAREHRLSRSERYARALLLFLQAQRYEGITAAIDAADTSLRHRYPETSALESYW